MTEVALSLVLLVGAGLALRAFVHLVRLDPGFEPRGLLAFRTGARGPGFELPEQRDGPGQELVAVLSADLARTLFGDRDPLGRAIDFDGERRRVVGIAGDVRGIASNPGAPSYVYLPHAQSPATPAMTVLARTAGEPLTVARPAEQVVWAISRDAPAYGATTMEQMLADADWRPRFLLQLLAVFALLALALAMSGIYAVLAAAVVERTREVGIRVAVGARRGDVLALVLADAGRLALAGIAVGLVLAAAASRLLEGQLQGVGTLDPPTYAAVSALLLAVALAAGAVPALRATRIDPVTALRSD